MNFRIARRRNIMIDAVGTLAFGVALLWDTADAEPEPARWVVFDTAFLTWSLVGLVTGILATTPQAFARQRQLDKWFGCLAAVIVLFAFIPALFATSGWELGTTVLGVVAAAVILCVDWYGLRLLVADEHAARTGETR